MTGLTHIDDQGAARMVDITGKPVTARSAIAEGHITMSRDALDAIHGGTAAKGDVLATARIAGIMAAKRTAELVPLCHPLPLSSVAIDFLFEEDGLRAVATTSTSARTGVEMEAMAAVSIALLTVYDMVKAVDKRCVIGGIRLIAKDGGKSGPWRA